MELAGKNVLVTGGGSGIGLGIAGAFAREGARVTICGRTEKTLQEGAATFDGQPPILTRTCDVADREDVRAMFAWLDAERGPVDVLVNSAGINVAARQFARLDPADWDRMVRINLDGAFNTMYFAVPQMRMSGGGLVVNISSIAGKRAMPLGGAGYCASKFGMTALGATVGLEERDHGIRVTNVYPGEVNTPILAQRPTPVPPEKLEKMLLPEDIAALVLTIAKLPARARVPEVVITPLYQEYA